MIIPFETYDPDNITFAEYEVACGKWSQKDGKEIPVLVAALGLAGEAGEVCDLLKKEAWHGKHVGVDELLNELGDVLWYVAALARVHGKTLEDVARANVGRLEARYPHGFREGGGIR